MGTDSESATAVGEGASAARRRAAPFGSRLLGPTGQSARTVRIRVQLLLTAMLLMTNLVGAGLVLLISAVVVPSPAPTGATVLSLAIGVPAYVVVAVLVGATVGTTVSLRDLRWATTDTTPDARAQTRTLWLPFRLTMLQFGLWLGATVLFTVLAVLLQPERAVTTGLTVGTAALVVSGVAYLLADFALRPIAARALAETGVGDRPRGVGLRARAVIFWLLGTAAPVLSLLVAAVVALTDDTATVSRLAGVVIVVTGVVLVIGLLVTVLHAGSVADPVLSVRTALLDVERGDLDTEVVIYDGTEVGLLQVGFNQMVGGLRERERIRDIFGRHVGQEVARQASSGDIELGGEVRHVTVLFVDLVGSTTYATEHPPDHVVEVLNRFFAVVVEEVDRHEGLVNKLMGDAVLAVFGAPMDLDDHAGHALAAARALSRRLAEEVPELGAGIGVAGGEVVAGNVGAESRYEYTVIGDAVNSAARLTELAKDSEHGVLATCATVEAAQSDEAHHWHAAGSTVLRGREDETDLAAPADA